jgi:molybdopterin-guanine dinucleotide biosynthesis protein A
MIVVGTESQREQIKEHLNGLTVITDLVSGVGPIGGILTGATYTREEYCQILPADSPLPNRDVLNYLAACANGYDAVVPVWSDGRAEPLHGLYRARNTAREAEALIARGEYAVISLVRSLNARSISVEELQQFDRELITFLNVNTREDINRIAGKLPNTA